jgi:hypothetical protein
MANTAPSKAAASGATPLSYRPPTNSPPSYSSYASGAPQTMSTYTTQLNDRKKKTDAATEAAAQHKKASRSSLAHSLLPDLPLLMHGSGDVLPEHVNPKSVAVLAQLTENYVEKLVRAAMDAHDIFTDGEVVGGGACLGIPPFPSSSYSATTAAAMHYDSDNDEDDNNNNHEKVDEMSEEAITRKRKRAEKEKISKKFKKIDYWDQPLPTAPAGGTGGGGGGIGGEEDSSNGGVDSSVNDDSDSSDDDSDNNDDSSSSQKLTSSSMRMSSGRKQSGFIGALPIDLHANQRTRDYYVSAPTAMDVRSFIFPICHDTVLYQRVKEMQANRRAIGRDMMDHVLLQAVQEEGVNLGRVDVSDMWSSVLNAAAVAAAEAEEAKAIGGSNNMVTSDVAGNNNKAKDGEEKKSVEAGLVDTNVDASWPGMNPLSRGKLWS